MDGTTTLVEVESRPRLSTFERGRELVLRSTPGWKFHLVLALATLPLFWDASSPAGGSFVLSMASLWVLFLGALTWISRLIIWLFSRRSDRPRTPGRGFLVAPLCAVVVAGLLFADIPFQARWNQAKPAMQSIVDGAPPTPSSGQPLLFEVPGRAGSYGLDRGMRVGADVFIYLSNTSGGFIGFLEAGFAYLPGRTDSERSNPVTGSEIASVIDESGGDGITFTHLTGNWYTFTASW